MKRIFKLFILVLVGFISFLFINNSVKAWFTSILIVYYQYEDKTTAAPTVRQYPSYGEAFSIESPVIEGYTPDKPVVEGVFSDSIAYWVTYYKNDIKEEYKLKINYLDNESNIISEAYENIFEKGYQYNIQSPIIKGYTPNIEVVEGILDSDTTIDVIYNKNQYEININYYDELGNIIYDSYNTKLYYLDEYEINSPNIYGYTPNIDLISGVIESNINYDVTYYKNSYELIINYIDEEGNKLFESTKNNYKYLDNYEIDIPSIYGYHTDINKIEGTILGNKEIDVIYLKNDYEIKINYVDESGNKLADSDIYSFKYLKEFSIEAKDIEGYTPISDEIRGIANKNQELDIVYKINKYILTINYLDECGRPILESYVEELDYNSYYEIESLEINGYKANYDIVKGYILEDTTIDVIYSKIKSTLIIYYVDVCYNNIICPSVYELDYYNIYTITTPYINGYYTDKYLVYGYAKYLYNEIIIMYYRLPKYHSTKQLSFNVYVTPYYFNYSFYYYVPLRRKLLF